MSTTTSNRERVQCFRCKYAQDVLIYDGKQSCSAESAARVLGWRVWPSGDDETPRMLCPLCAGTATQEQKEKIGGWNAECFTCGITMREDWADEDGPFTEKDAQQWRAEHRCETDIRVLAPQAGMGRDQ